MCHTKLRIVLLCRISNLSWGFCANARPRCRQARFAGNQPSSLQIHLFRSRGTAVGAGLGYILPGEKTPLKLAMIFGGGTSTWFLHTHRQALGGFHSFGMILSNTSLGGGIGWLGCNCNEGLIGGTLLGGGATAVWQALKNDRAARNAFSRAVNTGDSNQQAGGMQKQ